MDAVVKDWNGRDLSGQEYPFLVVDALIIRVRKGGRVRLCSVLIATGINREGYREILGLMIGDSESEATRRRSTVACGCSSTLRTSRRPGA